MKVDFVIPLWMIWVAIAMAWIWAALSIVESYLKLRLWLAQRRLRALRHQQSSKNATSDTIIEGEK
jgi:hypothetical protein